LKNILDIFKELTQIEKCSTKHPSFLQYVRNTSEKYAYKLSRDENNNILCKIKNSKAKLCLKVHYGTFLKKGTSSFVLDTRNDIIAHSCMLFLMSKHYDCEFLFIENTSINTCNKKIDLNAPYILKLNIKNEVSIVYAKNYNSKIIRNKNKLDLYEISLTSSKVEAKDIIKLLCSTIKNANAKLLDFNTKNTSFYAKAIIASLASPLKMHEDMLIEKIDAKSEYMNIYSAEIIDFILNVSNSKAEENQDKIQLSAIKTDHECIEVEMQLDTKQNIQKICKEYGFEIRSEVESTFEEKNNDFKKHVDEIYSQNVISASASAKNAPLASNQKHAYVQVASLKNSIYKVNSKESNNEQHSLFTLDQVLTDVIRYCND